MFERVKPKPRRHAYGQNDQPPRSVGSGLALTRTGTHGGLTVSLLEYPNPTQTTESLRMNRIDQKPPAPVAPSAPGSVPTVTVAALAPTARGRVGDLGTQQHAQQGPTQLQSVYLRRTPGTPWPEILGELPQKPMSIRYGPRKRYCYVELPVGAFEELRAAPPPGLFVGLATRRAANGKAPSQDREASPRERRSTAKEVVPVDDRTSPADDDEECLGRPRDSACACGEAQ
ncbi:hypothetical protein PAPYR_9052 [Paratrimastix pyriformis]|uniref:Uncharacterized protein n=1 Tax=Paratrimastix pyriformis TaxID=342808 RepID=A0ABQ8U9C5_9EUKA|nr:hypothetical protein PAPYR_9052 [Paratrimastix pyriformis]